MVQRKNGTIKITLWEGQAAMFAKKFSVGVSSVALAICGAGLGLPAYAQDAGATKASDAEATDESIIVTARRQALKDAINIKRDSDTIVDSVVADEAGKLPDTSVTEVLQRVSGVALSRFAVSQGNPAFQIEGSGISVRGLPYNSSMLNGRQVFSASGASARAAARWWTRARATLRTARCDPAARRGRRPRPCIHPQRLEHKHRK